MLADALQYGLQILYRHRKYISKPININRLRSLLPNRFEDVLGSNKIIQSYRESEILLDIGVVEYYAGNYERSYEFCSESNELVRSHLALACLGVGTVCISIYLHT
jgi:hypothetical protein